MFLSVIVPNYNGATFIDHFCQCLVSQTLASNQYEIIIVDNGSTDDSMDVFEKYKDELPNMRMLSYTEQQSSYAARNYGVGQSSGDVLVFTDVDCRPDSHWLFLVSKISDRYSEHFLLVGSVKLFPVGDTFNYYEWYDYLASLNQEFYSRQQTGATANLAVSRKAYERVGGFIPVISGGDRDFCRRVMQLGNVKFIYEPDVFVMHPARATVEDIKKKAYRVGQGHAELNFKGRSFSYRISYLLKNIFGLFLQSNQWKIIFRSFRKKEVTRSWLFVFALVALHMGFYARKNLLQSYLRLCIESIRRR